MSSSGINAINSGPLIIRTYNDSSSNKTYLLSDYDYPVPSNYVLITSTNGQLAPSNNIYISSISISSITADYAILSTVQISGFLTVNNGANIASTLCASTLCTSTLAMSNGQIIGISSINSLADSLNITAVNTSTIGNLNVTGDLDVTGLINNPGVPPVGAINMYGGNSDPPGWLICNGRSVTVANYPKLYSSITYTFGGTGVNFNIPDLRDKFPIGTLTNPLGATGGGTATLTEANLPSHRHGIIDVEHSHTATHTLLQNNTLPPNDNTICYEYDSNGDPSPMVITIASSFTGIVSTTNTGLGTSFNILPSFLSLNYIIKY